MNYNTSLNKIMKITNTRTISMKLSIETNTYLLFDKEHLSVSARSFQLIFIKIRSVT